jgi:hypothetical protein
MSGQAIIEPISIPQAAAINFGGADVRHVSSTTDPLSGDSISNATRQLAFRDVLLAQKVNEIVETINNKDQFINLPTVTTTLPGGAAQIVTNFRIPPGYEARVLNAIVSSVPSNSIKLIIGYNANQYGLTTYDTEAVSTIGEFSSGTSFYGTGEFVVSLTNLSGKTAAASASIALTMRPVAAQKGGIIGPGAVGPKGDKGDKGDPGDSGSPGSPGPIGPIGANWRGPWSSGSNFATRDLTQDRGSSWIAKVPNVNIEPPLGSVAGDATWDLIAQKGDAGPAGPASIIPGPPGSTGPVGPQGNTGPAGFVVQGVYNPFIPYSQTAVVTYVAGSISRTFYAGTNIPAGIIPTSPASGWIELFGPYAGAVYDGRTLTTVVATGTDYGAGVAIQGYGSIPPGSSLAMVSKESSVYGGPPGGQFAGISHLRGEKKAVFRGQITLNLPQLTDGSTQNWAIGDVNLIAAQHGTVPPLGGGSIPMVTTWPAGTASYTIDSNSPTPVPVAIFWAGSKMWPA